MVASRPPNPYLLAEVGDVQPGIALDAGCGHGSEAIWLATAGWQVTAVDFSATALDFGRSTAEAAGPDVAERIEWVEGISARGVRRAAASTSSTVSMSTWPGRSSTW